MTKVRIEWEWEAAPTIKAPELRATFARLRMHVGDDCLTLVEDQESGSSRRSIAVSLYPLAEWIAYNWWFLCAESRHAVHPKFAGSDPSVDSKRYQRHNIRNAGDGFLWPDLFILPDGKRTSLLWRPDRVVPSGWTIRFLHYGQTLVDSGELQQALGGFVQAVLDRLSDCEVGPSRLAEEWEAIQGADSEEIEYCLAAARLGLDPYSEAAEYEAEIVEAGNSLEPDVLREFLNVVDPNHISDELRWITTARSEIQKMTGPKESFVSSLAGELPKIQDISSTSPWRAGYRAAQSLREILGLGIDDVFDIDAYVEDRVVNSQGRSVQAFGKNVAASGPSLVFGWQQGAHSRRFTMARAMWNVLRRPTEPFLITTGHTIRQKVERAFAAELLVPAEGVASLIPGDIDTITDDDIERVGQYFNVSSLVVKHQIDNQVAS